MLGCLVTSNILLSCPSSIPRGCGLIESTFLGNLSVTLGQCDTSPSGSTKVMSACGLTILVILRYCQTLCLPFWYFAFKRAVTLRPLACSSSSSSQRTLVSLDFFALLRLVSKPISIDTAIGSLAIFETTFVVPPVVSWLYITTPVIPIPC